MRRVTKKIFRGSLMYNLDENPIIRGIGDVVTINEQFTMILEIETIFLKNEVLTVTYIVQDMSKPVTASEILPQSPVGYEQPVFVSIYDRHDETLNDLKVGHTYNHRGCVYKVLEFTHLELNGEELNVGFIVKPISPISPEKLRQKRMEYKKQQVNFTVLNNTSPKQRI